MAIEVPSSDQALGAGDAFVLPDGVTPTLDMVAAAAGVSRTTASRVINGSTHVTTAASDAVNAAIERLHYVPNRAARNLASKRTQLIAVVVPEHTSDFFADPYFGAFIQGAARRLSSTDYTLTLLVASEADPDKTRRFLMGGNVDGALILSHHSGDPGYVHLSKSLPVVFASKPLVGEEDSQYVVDIDNVAAAREATQHLITTGRTRLATITGNLAMTAGRERLEGWQQAIADAGLEPGPIVEGDFSLESGAAAVDRLIEGGEPFDALFVASAKMAFAAISALKRHGRQVPTHVAVTTIDNDFYAQNPDMRLTTIDQHTALKGATIVEVLMRLIAGETVERFTSVPTEFVVGDSA
jgi:DNA-binding LacI/PurR family transcriptional regulator